LFRILISRGREVGIFCSQAMLAILIKES
jgi:hypothetical protein